MTFWPSATANYALHALITLSRHDRPVQAGELHRRDGIPPKYVDNVMTPLRRAGLVTSKRGHHGGYRLARPASEITVHDVVAAIDHLAAPEWLPDEGDNSAATAWVAVADAAHVQMRSITLADLARHQSTPAADGT